MQSLKHCGASCVWIAYHAVVEALWGFEVWLQLCRTPSDIAIKRLGVGVVFTSKASVVWPAEWAAALTCVHVTGSPSSVFGCSTTAEQLFPRDPALV